MASILRQGIALSAARYIEQAIMLLTPVVLVRTIGPTEFGEYRLFWLLVTTVALLFPFDMPRSLLFFFIRFDAVACRLRFWPISLHAIAAFDCSRWTSSKSVNSFGTPFHLAWPPCCTTCGNRLSNGLWPQYFHQRCSVFFQLQLRSFCPLKS